MTAVEWLFENLAKTPMTDWYNVREQAIQMEDQQRIKDYNAGYDDAKCNHINDAENYVNEIKYIQSKIDYIDNQIKHRENNIAHLLIHGYKNE